MNTILETKFYISPQGNMFFLEQNKENLSIIKHNIPLNEIIYVYLLR